MIMLVGLKLITFKSWCFRLLNKKQTCKHTMVMLIIMMLDMMLMMRMVFMITY